MLLSIRVVVKFMLWCFWDSWSIQPLLTNASERKEQQLIHYMK